MIRLHPVFRALGLAWTLAAAGLAGPVPAAPSLLAPGPQPALLTRPGDPASWASFEECLELV